MKLSYHPVIPKFISVLGIATTGILVADPAHAVVLYDQPPGYFVDGVTYSYFSQNDTAVGGFGNFATMYDNFTLSTTNYITGVNWSGLFYAALFPPITPSITQFTISILADAGGQPGAVLSQSVISGNANETPVSIYRQIYQYSANISQFTANAGTQYWLAIVPDLDSPPKWGWQSGTGGNGISYQDFLGSRHQVLLDMSFSLSGSPVAVPFETEALPLLGSTILFWGAVWAKSRLANRKKK